MGRVGSQEPTLRVALPYDKTDGDIACALMAMLGQPPDDAQRGVLNDWLALDDGGKWVHFRNFLEAPRQNLKTWTIRARIIYGVVIRGERILYTAHNSDTAAEIRDIMLELVGQRPGDPNAKCRWLNRRMSRTRMTNGHEAIYFKNGGRVAFSTRTNSSKLGFTVDVIIVDEAQEFRESQSAAILSTASAAPLKNPQYIFAGTPPIPGCFGDVFQTKRDDIASGADDGTEGTVSLNEWSANDVPGFEPTAESVRDKDLWYRINPALGTRINEATVAGELGTYTDPLTFAQQRLGWWLPKESVNAAIPRRDWDRAAVSADAIPADGVKAFGVKFSPDGSRVCCSVALRCDDGPDYVELVFDKPTSRGTAWLARFLADAEETAAEVWVDGKTGAGDLVDKLDDLGCARKYVHRPTADQVATAASTLVLALAEDEPGVVHWDGPNGEQKALDDSATTATKRKIGDGYGFDGEDATPVESASLALLAARTTTRVDGGGEIA